MVKDGAGRVGSPVSDGEGLDGERRCQGECWQALGPGMTWEATGVVVAMAEMG